ADPRPAAADPRAERAAEQRAEDRDAAVPDVPHGVLDERVPPFPAAREVEAPVRHDVEGARPDEREDHGRQADVDDDPGLTAALREPAVRDEGRDDDADEDAERVDVDRERSERERSDRPLAPERE